MLREIEETATSWALPYYYLGYVVPGCERMAYKAADSIRTSSFDWETDSGTRRTRSRPESPLPGQFIPFRGGQVRIRDYTFIVIAIAKQGAAKWNTETYIFDNNATTPLHPEVKKALIEGLEIFGNPSSMHAFGREARERIEEAREKVASFIGADSDEILFVGSGSEANNTVLSLLALRQHDAAPAP